MYQSLKVFMDVAKFDVEETELSVGGVKDKRNFFICISWKQIAKAM